MNVLKCGKCKKISYSSRADSVKCPYCGNLIIEEKVENEEDEKEKSPYVVFKMKFHVKRPPAETD